MENSCKILFFNVMLNFVMELNWENVNFQNNNKS